MLSLSGALFVQRLEVKERNGGNRRAEAAGVRQRWRNEKRQRREGYRRVEEWDRA